MKNKVLIKLNVPRMNVSFDIFIPVNEIVWKVKKLLVKSVSDLTNTKLDINGNYYLINEYTGKIYGNNEIIINTDIRNSSVLSLVSDREGIEC